ncbi:MAG: hypothetical protein QNK23_06160 [Crocinitomicaceae bacterium]|nr:hypothetical protein [Crocinitomicaceae bacterium]
MKIVIVSSLLGILILSSTIQSRIDTEQLLSKNWHIYKTVEVIAGDTTIYDEIYINLSGDTIRSFNTLGGDVQFTTDSTGFYKSWLSESFTWRAVDEDHIEITIDSLKYNSRNKHFFGPMKILKINDSTAILKKNISSNGRWTRTFYLKVK